MATKKDYEADLKKRSYVHYRADPIMGTPIEVYDVGNDSPSHAHYVAKLQGVPLKEVVSCKIPPRVLAKFENDALIVVWGRDLKEFKYDPWLDDGDVDRYLNDVVLEYLKKEWVKSHKTSARPRTSRRR